MRPRAQPLRFFGSHGIPSTLVTDYVRQPHYDHQTFQPGEHQSFANTRGAARLHDLSVRRRDQWVEIRRTDMTDQRQNQASTPLTGRVIQRGEPGWERARRNFNARIDPQSVEPKMIVFVQNAADVRHALAYARANQLPFRVRCGGHSYEAYSLVKDGLVIDVSDINHIIYDPATGHVTVGARARCLDVAERLPPADRPGPLPTLPSPRAPRPA